jgi:hypothetical protein
MANNILIAGAGQLGSRYLQGLSNYMKPLTIWVYDISFSSLECARKRWEECSGELHRVEYIKNLADIPSKIDMVFVTTNSDVRLEVVNKITQIASVRYWILEKVLARTITELYSQADVTTGSSGVWVNTPMYLWPLYRALRKNILGNKPIHARFIGMHGLACNAIHYIDFVSRWNHGKITAIETSGLNRVWVPSKRTGFFEVEGEIVASFSDGSTLTISGNSKPESYRVEIRIEDDIWEVDDNKGLAHNNSGKIIRGTILRQSELIAPLLDEIFTSGRCELPTLVLSISQHEPLLKALLAHWNANMPEKLDYVPIT